MSQTLRGDTSTVVRMVHAGLTVSAFLCEQLGLSEFPSADLRPMGPGDTYPYGNLLRTAWTSHDDFFAGYCFIHKFIGFNICA